MSRAKKQATKQPAAKKIPERRQQDLERKTVPLRVNRAELLALMDVLSYRVEDLDDDFSELTPEDLEALARLLRLDRRVGELYRRHFPTGTGA